jgi:hypothetical protein
VRIRKISETKKKLVRIRVGNQSEALKQSFPVICSVVEFPLYNGSISDLNQLPLFTLAYHDPLSRQQQQFHFRVARCLISTSQDIYLRWAPTPKDNEGLCQKLCSCYELSEL